MWNGSTETVEPPHNQFVVLADLRKGAIQPGADADLVVYDPAYRGALSKATQTHAVDYNAFEGWEIQGRPAVVTVRGAVAVRDGKFVGEIGRGRFLERAT